MKTVKISGILLTVVMVISFAVYFTVKDSTRIKSLHMQYKSAYGVGLNGIVKDLYTEKGACFVTIGSKKMFLNALPGDNYPERYLDNILSKGDSIVKRPLSDTVFIYKKDAVYFFVLAKNRGR